MQDKKILIATNGLGIGGCETYVVTMAKELVKKGYKVSIVANDGIFRTYLEKIGIKVNILNFADRSKSIENIDYIEKIIKEEHITDVCIHPFYAFFEAVIASIKQGIPYDLVFHGVSLKGYFDIRDAFSVLGVWSNIYIKNIATKYARKYIYVSEEVRNFYEQEFELEHDRGIMLKNSINIEQNLEAPNKLKKFVMLSRIDNDKIDSIKCGIEFYKKLYDEDYENGNMCFDIVGTGTKEQELKEFIEKNSKYNINIIEATDDSCATMNQYDAVIGMGRSIIEAMSMKKFIILVTYNKYIGIVDSNNIDKMNQMAYANFSGRNMKEGNIQEDVISITKATEEKIKNIIEKNYEYVSKNQNIEKNIAEYLYSINNGYENNEDAEKELVEYLNIIKYIDLLTKTENEKNYEVERYKSIESIKNQEIETLKTTINQNNIENEKNKETIKEQQSTIDANATEIAGYKEMVEKNNEEITKAKKQIDEQNNIIGYNLKKVKNAEEKILAQENELNNKNIIIEELKKEVEIGNNKIEEYSNLNKIQKDENTHYRTLLNNIYNKKTYKTYQKIKKIFKKIKFRH